MKIHTIDLQFQDIPQTIGAFLIEHEKGPILVETGPYRLYAYFIRGVSYPVISHIDKKWIEMAK